MNRCLRTLLRKATAIVAMAAVASGPANAGLLISQYVETDSGTTPKGIEIWNPTANPIDFSVTNLDVRQGTNGGAPSSTPTFTLTTGTLAAGDVWVIGTSDMGTYLDSEFGAANKNFSLKAFSFNGDDSLTVYLGGVLVDVFGDPGTGDPGTGWSGNGVQTYNQNLQILDNITTGATAGWTDPSTRFETVSSSPTGAGGLAGFGVAPASAPQPEPSGPSFYWVGSDATRGGDGTWVGTGGTAWATADADQAGGAWDATKTAAFAGVTAGTVTVSGTVDADTGITFSTDGYTLSGGTLDLGGADAATNALFTGTGVAATIGSVITGSTGLTKSGAGTLTLSGTNTFSGGTTVSAGTLSVSSDANLGGAAGGITVAGGSLAFTSGFTLGSGRTLTAAESTASTLDIGSGLTVTFDGEVAGSGNLNKIGAGQLTLGNASTGYSGTFTISAGTVELTASGAFANATVTQTGGTLLLNPAGAGTDIDVPDFGGEGGEVSVASGKKANFGGDGNRSYRGQIRGQGGLKKSGSGQLTLDQINDFAGATDVTAGILEIASGGALSETSGVDIASGGRLKLNGRIGRAGKAADVSVAFGGILSGAGQVIGTVGGAGGVGPGNSPGILEATATDPSGGLDYEFEFTGLTPDYGTAGASVNDLFRLTDTSSPFSGSLLDANNVIDLYFNDGSFAEGRTYTGGFFIDATSGQFGSFLDAIDSAAFNVYVADAGGGVVYEGTNYLSLADYNTANSLGLSVNIGVATIPSATFAGGTVTNGQAMQLVVVPEPDAFLLGGLGLALVGLVLGRRRTSSEAQAA